jgi:hypothetical protein
LWFLLPFGTSGGFFIRRSLSKILIKSYAAAAGVGFNTSRWPLDKSWGEPEASNTTGSASK